MQHGCYGKYKPSRWKTQYIPAQGWKFSIYCSFKLNWSRAHLANTLLIKVINDMLTVNISFSTN